MGLRGLIDEGHVGIAGWEWGEMNWKVCLYRMICLERP